MSETAVNKENKKKIKKEKKKRKGLFNYLKETKAELKRVTWTTSSKTIKNTLIVITTIAVAVVFSFIIDTGISFFLKILIK